MNFLPMKSQTESILDPGAGYMEFDLASDLGYQEWCGMFAELGVKATLFNGYLIQSAQGVQVSTTPVQFHLFDHAMYLAPPFEAKSYYFEIPRATIKLGKVYFRIPSELSFASLDGYKPKREELYAIDMWVDNGGVGEEGVGQQVAGNQGTTQPSAGQQSAEPQRAEQQRAGQQAIYTLVYEAKIQSDRGEYHITRFESEQLNRY